MYMLKVLLIKNDAPFRGLVVVGGKQKIWMIVQTAVAEDSYAVELLA